MYSFSDKSSFLLSKIKSKWTWCVPESLYEGHALDVSDGSSELDDADFRLRPVGADRDLWDALHPLLDGVGNVRNNLNENGRIFVLFFRH